MKNNARLTGQIQDTAALTQDEVQKSVKAGDIAERQERQERLFRQGATPAPVGAARLRQNTEIAQELYRRLQTALEALRLQRDLVSGDVTITGYAETPSTPS